MIAATLLIVLVSSHSIGSGWSRAQSRGQPPDLGSLEQAVAARPGDVVARQRLADAYLIAGRPMDAVAQLRSASTTVPRNPRVWYALGQAYNAVKQSSLAGFTNASDAPWRTLLSADALLENKHLTDAFTLYRAALDALPGMVNIHDSIVRIYERTGHADWASIERAKIHLPADACVERRAMCEFRAGRYRTSLDAALKGSDAEARYWTARAANELALNAFSQLETLPDSPERRSVRAAVALAQERYLEAVAEFKAAVQLSPGQPELHYQLASAYYSARDYDQALTTLAPLLESYPNDSRLLNLKARALLELRRPDEAIPILKQLVDRSPDDARARLTLGRAYAQSGNYKDAIPLLETQLESDTDGSQHMQLARAYVALGQREKATPLMTRSEELRKGDDERRAAQLGRAITAPK
jgi:predicted Zn-dependent protease